MINNDAELRELYDDIDRYKEYLEENLPVKDRKFFETGIENIKKRIRYYE